MIMLGLALLCLVSGHQGNVPFLMYVSLILSHTYNKSSIKVCHRRNEKDKRRKYGERICYVEHASSIPLDFTTAGGMCSSASTFYKHLSSRLSIRYSKSYSTVLNWIRCRISFSLLLCVSVVPDHPITILATLSTLMSKLSQTGESINLHVASCIL